MNRYYTPDIEEFHVGFEYATYWNDNKLRHPFGYWRENIFSQDDLQNAQSWALRLKRGDFKVRFLERSDIESSEWYYKGGQMIKGGKSYFSNQNNTIGITLRPDFYKDHHSSVHIYELKPEGGIRDTIFSGKVKNRTKFKEIIESTKYEK